MQWQGIPQPGRVLGMRVVDRARQDLLRARVPIAVIGPVCVLVTPDVLGLYEDFKPRFVRKYSHLADEIRTSIGKYVKDVKDRKFPSDEESY